MNDDRMELKWIKTKGNGGWRGEGREIKKR
jgi:hypothetical protein